MLTCQLHDLAAIVEVAIEHPEYSKHKVLLQTFKNVLF